MSPLVQSLFLTGCGGDIAISIARLVREDGLASRLIGADVQKDHAGHAFFDEVIQLPRADSPGYLEALGSAVAAYEPDLVVPLSEAELARLSTEKIPEQLRSRLLMANTRSIQVGLDKLLTFETLNAAGIPAPRTGLVGHGPPPPLPCIVKLRRGQGSKGLTLVEDWNFQHVLSTRAGDLWQEYLSESDQEFTCGLFRSAAQPLRSIALRRTLSGGLTGSAEVVEDSRISRELERIADALELEGAINVQLRLEKGEPKVFEINPRFSSTVGFRHRLGFRDFEWSVLAALGKPLPPYSPPPAGVRMYRVGTEVIRR